MHWIAALLPKDFTQTIPHSSPFRSSEFFLIDPLKIIIWTYCNISSHSNEFSFDTFLQLQPFPLLSFSTKHLKWFAFALY